MPSNFSPLRSQCANRCPSVATIVIDSGFNSINAPFSVYRDSSFEIANPVRAINPRNTCAGIVTTPAVGNAGRLGKFDFAIPTLGQDAALTFEINLAALSAADRDAFLTALAAGNATVAVKNDAPGSVFSHVFTRLPAPTPDDSTRSAMVVADSSFRQARSRVP